MQRMLRKAIVYLYGKNGKREMKTQLIYIINGIATLATLLTENNSIAN